MTVNKVKYKNKYRILMRNSKKMHYKLKIPLEKEDL